MKILAYCFNTPLELTNMTNGYEIYRNRANYERWANTEHGQWCLENNIQPISTGPQYNPSLFSYFYHSSCKITWHFSISSGMLS